VKKILIILVICLCGLSNSSLANDEQIQHKKWLIDFLKPGLDEATAFWKIQDKDNFNKEEEVDIHFDFNTNVYQYNFSLTYSENWDILTHDGTEDPPEIKKRYTSSIKRAL